MKVPFQFDSIGRIEEGPFRTGDRQNRYKPGFHLASSVDSLRHRITDRHFGSRCISQSHSHHVARALRQNIGVYKPFCLLPHSPQDKKRTAFTVALLQHFCFDKQLTD